ncbi:MAG: ATP-binding protein [bacterium]
MVNRTLDLACMLKNGHSAFLFGPRGVGKTLLSKEFIKSNQPSFTIDLLSYDLYTRYISQPSLFRKEIEAAIKPGQLLTVFIDEIQKLPLLLDEIHSLIESHKGQIQFLLTGSSARKLKRGGANLLAGRAWTLRLHPLTHQEVNLDLNKALEIGTLPAIYLEESGVHRTLKAYVETYLKEEIMQEALVRKVDSYIRFMDIAGQMNGEPLNFTSIARDCGVSIKTVQEFVSILVDTLLAFRIEGWTYSIRKQLRQSPKIYFFDCGVLNAVRGELGMKVKPNSFIYGKRFETFVILELIRLNDYLESGYKFHYWRTNTGLEVDLILSRRFTEPSIAIEIKSRNAPTEADVHALRSFKAENPKAELFCLCTTQNKYRLGAVLVCPWQEGIREILGTF